MHVFVIEQRAKQNYFLRDARGGREKREENKSAEGQGAINP